MPLWESPYKLHDKSDIITLTVDVSRRDNATIKSVAAEYGTITRFFQTIFHDLAEYVRTNNLTYLDSDAFIHYLRQRADSRLAPPAGARNESGRTAGVHKDPATRADKPSGVLPAPKGRQRTGKGQKA